MASTTIPSNYENVWAQIEPDVLKILRSQTVTRYSYEDFTNSSVQIIPRRHNIEFVKYIYAKGGKLIGAHAINIMTSLCNLPDDCGLCVSSFNKQWALYDTACYNLAKLYGFAEEENSICACCPKIWSRVILNIGLGAWYNEMLKTGFKEKLMKSLVNLVHEFRSGVQKEEMFPEMSKAIFHLSIIYRPNILPDSVEIRAFKDLMLIEFFQPVYQIYIEALNYHSKMVELDDELRIVENLVKHFKLDKVWIKAVFAEEYGNCVFSVILENIFEPFKPTILRNLGRLFEEDRYEALSSLYFVFKDISDGSVMTRLTSKFDAIVKREAKGIASESAEAEQLVKDLAKLCSKRFKMIQTVFRGDSKFLDRLKRTVAPILNKKTGPNSPCKSPEMLAKLLDSLMRNKDLPEIEIMEELDQIGLIYQMLFEKDVFISFYFLLTAKRLHQKGFRSLKLEEGLLQRLPEWGIRDQTLKSNIVTMIEDVLTSNNVLEYFNKFKGDFGFVFTAQVMKIQTWPICSSDNAQIVLSNELRAILEIYENNHRLFFNNRKLVWNYLHSTSEIQINYLNKLYLLSLNTYQMAIMLLFEKNNHLGFMYIKETLAIPEETLVDQLACLVESKLLIAHPMVFNDTCQLWLNFEFRNGETRVEIPSIPAHREAFLEKTEDLWNVRRQRHYIVKAAIVRFAKRHSPISHDHLLFGVRKMLEDKFELEIPLFENAIAKLIDLDYLQNGPGATNVYRYFVP